MHKIVVLLMSVVMSVGLVTHDVHASSFSFGGVRMSKPVKPMCDIKREYVTIQSLDFSCGAAGLATLLNYYLNDPVTEQDIISKLLELVPLEKVIARRGFSMLDLKTYARSRGYKVTGYKMDIEFLRQLRKPVLIPIRFRKYSHFVIAKGVVGDRIFIADPSAGNLTLKIDKFQRMWYGGIGLVVEYKDKTVRGDYALRLAKENLRIADYKSMARMMYNNAVRTAIYPSEWK